MRLECEFVFGHSRFVWSYIKLGLEVLSALTMRQGWIEVSYGLLLLQCLEVVCKTKYTNIRHESEFFFFQFHIPSVHLDIIKVLFIPQLMH